MYARETVLRWGRLIVDHAWLMPQTASEPARLFPEALAPELVARCEPEPASEPEPGEADLYQSLASYSGDQSTEAGVSEVVFVTADHPEWNRRYRRRR